MPLKETRNGLTQSLTVWLPFHISQKLKMCAQVAGVTATEIVVKGLELAMESKEYSLEHSTERWIEQQSALRGLQEQSEAIAQRLLYTRLIAHIAKLGGSATVRELCRCRVKNLRTAGELKDVLQDMADKGLGRLESTIARNGLHSIKFTLAPGYQDVVQYSVSGTGTENTKGDVENAESNGSGQAGSETPGVSAEG